MKFSTHIISTGILSVSLISAFVSAQAAEIRDHNIKVAFVQQADHPQGLALQKFSEVVKEKSKGKMKVAVFAGGTLGGDAAVLSSLQGGTIEMTLLATSLLGSQIKEYAMFDLPFLFQNSDEADTILDTTIGKKLMDKLPQKGLVGLAYWEHGFRSLTNSKRSVEKLEDIQGLKIRVLQLPLYVDMFNALGANAVPMPYPELYTGLETKTVDGQENTFSAIETAKFDEVQKYLSTTRHVYQPLALLYSKRAWDRLNADEQKILTDAAQEVRPYERKLIREAEEKSLSSMRAKGIVVTEFSQKAADDMKNRLKPVIDKYSKEAGQDFANELKAELEKIRNKK